MRNLQEQVKKAFCYQKFFWPFTAWINCSIDLKNFANFFLTGQNNFCNKIPYFTVHLQFIPSSYFTKIMLKKSSLIREYNSVRPCRKFNKNQSFLKILPNWNYFDTQNLSSANGHPLLLWSWFFIWVEKEKFGFWPSFLETIKIYEKIR